MNLPAPPEIRPKICIVSTTPLIVHFFLREHIKALSISSEILLVVNPDNDTYTPALDLPVRLIPIKIQRRIAIVDDLLALRQLYDLLKNEKPDLVWAIAPKAGLIGMLASLLAGIKHRVFLFQGEVWAARSGLSRYLLKTADKITSFCANHILVVSHSEQGFLETEGVIQVGKSTVLGGGSISGVNLDRFKPDLNLRISCRAEHNIPENALVCLFLGRITSDKGVYDLANAFAYVSKAHPELWLVFVGPDEENVSKRIFFCCGTAANRVLINGFTDKPEEFLAMADFLCLPSYREGFGMVVLEAAAFGIPAIGSRIYGVSDAIIDEVSGLLFSVGNEIDLAEQINRLASDPGLRVRLGRAARDRVLSQFSESDVVDRYIKFINGLIERDRH
ncbi:glycosyltransferase family 4 protein [Methylomonas montana]|uniref:glycosyltransferase family 4 protein n=1 Tax=Methylomonas montana TaxID=3058963 RepID=UPI002659D544|nr:glycosyltransferase family 4 protein [Methylomonas montana]WKJ92036.1 glycosyltransferase family 4 protein [Methylomonas montana]